MSPHGLAEGRGGRERLIYCEDNDGEVAAADYESSNNSNDRSDNDNN